MSEKHQQIAAKIMHLLLLQAGDCRADDYVEDDTTVANLLNEYESHGMVNEARPGFDPR